MNSSTLKIIFTFLFCISPNIVNAQSLAERIADGKQIYQQGILPNGQPLSAIAAGKIELSGEQISCMRCHRRSGFGSTEGNARILPILGDILYNARKKQYKELRSGRIKRRKNNRLNSGRPAYTDSTLTDAITRGLGADKRTLNQLMPRYKLTETQVSSLIAYLKSLTLKTDPGITKNKIHIATILSEDVEQSSSQAMLDLLKVYLRDVNAQTRKEQKRASNAPWHKQWEYNSYRKIELHIWKLTGTTSTWEKQLTKFYNKQNVFAVINGISNHPWKVIHQFCNKTALPCLFPTTELPNLEQNNQYNIYLSGGIAFDAKTIASHISKNRKTVATTVLQVYRDSAKNKIAIQTLQNDLSSKKITINNYKISNSTKISSSQWNKIINQYKPDILISWLDSADIKELNTNSVKTDNIEKIYYSHSHIGDDFQSIITENKNKSYIVYRNMLPQRKKLHMKRATVWAKRKNVDVSQEEVIGNVFFAITLFNRSIKKMRAYLKRDYLIELVESALENNAFHSVYPELSLGPDQRIASKGAYILGPLDKPDVNKKENHVWIRH